MSNKPNYNKPSVDMKRYRDFKVKISQIPPMDLAFQNMAINEYELLVATIYRLNDLIEVHNQYTEKIDEILEWLINDGLELAVLEQLNVWLNDGTLEVLINETLFNMKLDKTEFEDYKTIVNQVLLDLEQSIQTNIDDEISRIDGELEDLETNKADKTLFDDEISRVDGKLEDLETLFDDEISRVDGEIKETSKRIPFHTVVRFENEIDDDLAFSRMNNYLNENNGGIVYLEPRQYLINNPIHISQENTSLIGVPRSSVIKASDNFVLGNTEAVMTIKKGVNVPMHAIRLQDFHIDCNSVDCNGLLTHVLYDNIVLENLFVYNTKANRHCYRIEGNIRPTQTGIVNNCIAQHEINVLGDGIGFYLYKVQEYIFNGCKAFSGVTSDSELVSQHRGFYIENCRGVVFNLCSTVGAIGWTLKSNSFEMRGISINDPRLENITSQSLATSTSGTGTIEQISFINPSTFDPVGSINLVNVKKSTINADMLNIGISGSTENDIRVDNYSKVTYWGEKNNNVYSRSKDWNDVELVNGWTGNLQYRYNYEILELQGSIDGENKTSNYFWQNNFLKVHLNASVPVSTNNGVAIVHANADTDILRMYVEETSSSILNFSGTRFKVR